MQKWSLAESPEGILWVATTSGAALGTARGFKSLDTGESGSVRTVAFDRLGRVYLEYLSGIVRGVPDGVGSYRFHRVVPGATSSVSVNGDDVWFGKDGDLWHLVGDKAERLGSPLALPFDRWDAVAKDAHGNLWARSLTRLYCLPSGQTRFVNRSEGIPAATDTRLYADRHGRMLVSSESGVVVLTVPIANEAPAGSVT
jgi:ligand-binding sensor domain-containing protein